jgi:hypothetical protein
VPTTTAPVKKDAPRSARCARFNNADSSKTKKTNKTIFKMMVHGLLDKSFARYDEMVCEKI